MKSHRPLLTSVAATTLLLGAAQFAHAASLGAEVGATVNSATTAVTDTALTTSIKAKLAGDSRIKSSSNISVTTNNGVAVLTGTAPDHESKKVAEELALKIDGVTKVDNRIEAPSATASLGADIKAGTKATGEKVTDGWITTKVKTQLLADELTKGSKIKVDTKDNIVRLSGKAGSEAEKAQAIKLAVSTEGVKEVDASKLKVVTSTKVSSK